MEIAISNLAKVIHWLNDLTSTSRHRRSSNLRRQKLQETAAAGEVDMTWRH